MFILGNGIQVYITGLLGGIATPCVKISLTNLSYPYKISLSASRRKQKPKMVYVDYLHFYWLMA